MDLYARHGLLVLGPSGSTTFALMRQAGHGACNLIYVRLLSRPRQSSTFFICCLENCRRINGSSAKIYQFLQSFITMNRSSSTDAIEVSDTKTCVM